MWDNGVNIHDVRQIRTRCNVWFGVGAIDSIRDIVLDMVGRDIKSVLVVTGSNSYKSSGAWGRIEPALKAAGITYAVYNEVTPYPTTGQVDSAVLVGRDIKAEAVIGIGGGSIGKLPLLLLWVLITGAVGYIVLNRTPYGKKVLAVGGNATSARYSGINVKKIVVYVFVYSSLMAALGGMLYAGRMSSGRYTFGDGLELDAIASVILGGTSMAGGNGSIVGAIIGSLLIGTINNGLMFFGLSTAQQTVAKGAIIILSVALSALVSLHDNNNK